MVLTLRNRLPFTRVHSHAVAQKSSGAFFRVMARERCWKWLTRYRVALRAFQRVRPRTLMLNAAVWRVHTSHIMLSLRLSPERKSPPAEVEWYFTSFFAVPGVIVVVLNIVICIYLVVLC